MVPVVDVGSNSVAGAFDRLCTSDQANPPNNSREYVMNWLEVLSVYCVGFFSGGFTAFWTIKLMLNSLEKETEMLRQGVLDQDEERGKATAEMLRNDVRKREDE